ncbi:MAG: 5-methyltetrahydropteroyltriglutamate--homocysteine S-methyltransferase, partial [Alphaproteobacteria bacterium]
MVSSAILGFPRIGAERELKKALESYWKGEKTEAELLAVAAKIRAENWQRQQAAGIRFIPSADFSLYDQVLDHIHMFGATPGRYAPLRNGDPLTLYFAMARGYQKDGIDVVAMEMTKWFDTNYHYLVPEFTADQHFVLTTDHTLGAYKEAKAQGIETRPVILG